MTPACQKSGAAVSIREDVAVTGGSEVGERWGGTKKKGRRKWGVEGRDGNEGHILKR